jgi:DNA-binding NarL/FixJ family response regulator
VIFYGSEEMKRLLIVDNSLQLGHWLQIAVAQVDPQVEAKPLLSGEEALLEGTRHTIDLLVTDIRLTGMSGLELIRKMRKQHPLLRVIVLTDLAQADLQKQLDEIGVDAFFNKPLKVSLFMDSVASLLRRGESLPSIPAERTVDSQSMKTTVLHTVSAVPLPPTTILHPKPGSPAEKSSTSELIESDKILVMLISRLHRDSGALAVVLLNENGQVVAQVGLFPDPAFTRKWVGPLVKAAQTGKAVLEVMDVPGGRQEMVFHGSMFDLVLTSIGDYPLILALRKGYTAVRLAFVFEEIQTAHKELLGHLGGHPESILPSIIAHGEPAKGKPAAEFQEASLPSTPETLLKPSELKKKASGLEKDSTTTSTPPVEKQPLVNLDEVLQQPDQLKPGDVDTFWDEISKNVRHLGSIPDTITFEQARKMGLFHDLEEDIE